MSFNLHSLERLRKLSRQLPKRVQPESQSIKSNQDSNPKLHSIETEENPSKLFQELIKASPDGNIPKHLLSRLKQVEEKALNNKNTNESISEETSSHEIHSNQSDNLYTSFKRLLLEEEE